MSEQNVMEAPSGFEADEFDGGNAYGGNDNGSDGGDEGGSSAPGTGQSKSSRRRRRKRKNKVGVAEGGATEGGQAPGAQPIIMEGESLALAAAASATSGPRKQQSNNNGQGGGQSSGQNTGQSTGQGGGQQPQGAGQQAAGGKRWKKKFRDRERRPGRTENPGNDFRAEAGSSASSSSNGGGGGYRQDYRPDNFGNGGGFKRKSKGGGQGKERGFVGPMDHSYREGNGSFVDAPPSTIQLHGAGGRRGHRHHGDNQPIDHSMPRPIPIPENAQTHIYFFIEELFFIAKIQETARKQGVKVAFVKNDKDAVAELTAGAEENRPALIVFDLNNANAKPLTLIPKLKAKLKRSVSIVGFLSHLQGDLKAKAVEAGCDVVMPRAAFSQNLPNLLRRYGVEEAEEVNFNR